MKEQEIIELLKMESEEFKKLSEEHRLLDQQLLAIDSKTYLNTDEEMERKRVQKLKLLKKDRMAELIREYKRNHAN